MTFKKPGAESAKQNSPWVTECCVAILILWIKIKRKPRQTCRGMN